MRKKTTTFTGPFSKNIEKYLKEKVSVGNKIESYIYYLKSFDTFTKENNFKGNILTKELINNWLKLRPNEKRTNQASRANVIRGFSKYMNILDKKSYVLPSGVYSCNSKYNTYIYSENEICLIFNKIDNLVKIQPNKKCKNYSSQIIFRLLYMCGLRISEALNLKIKDYDKEQKLLIIRNGKKNKDRIVPINEELNNLIINYIDKFYTFSNDDVYLFSGRNNTPYTRFTIYKRFRVILELCEIEHNNKTLHSFRHTYAVHCLKKWVMENKNLMVYLPVLKTFLGHDSFRETAYYLKLTSDVYPNITRIVEMQYNNLIPQLEGKRMKKRNKNDFAYYLTNFFTSYLVNQKNLSNNTIKSYRDTFKILLQYFKEVKNIDIPLITLKNFSKEIVVGFLEYLENERNNSISTRNQRLASIHAFCRFIQAEEPIYIDNMQKIINIPFKKRIQKVIDYLTPEAMKLLLAQPDISSRNGFRDLVIMSLLYDTGARVQELIDLKVKDIRIEVPYTVTLNGKGNKMRQVPIMNNTNKLLKEYIIKFKQSSDQYLFESSKDKKFTRKGICYIINKYTQMAQKQSSIISNKVSPHQFRHSKAMHLLQSGINLIYIRDFLGHTDIQITEIYAKYDTETKRNALENAYPDLIQEDTPNWKENDDLLKWLNTL